MRNPPARTDGNQTEIVHALQAAGFSVQDLHMVGGGCPDIIVAGRDGSNVFMEIKMPGKRLNPLEAQWFNRWPGEKHVVHSAEEALNVMGV